MANVFGDVCWCITRLHQALIIKHKAMRNQIVRWGIAISTVASTMGIGALAAHAAATTSAELITSAAGDVVTQLGTNFAIVFGAGVGIVLLVFGALWGLKTLLKIIRGHAK